MFKIFSSSGLPAVDEAFAARRPVLDGLKSRLLRITKNTPMKYLITTIAAVVLVGCGRFENSTPASDTKPELKSSKQTDDSGQYIMSEPGTQGGVFSSTLKADGSFLGVTVTSSSEDNPIIGSWKAEGELLILEGTNKKDSEATKIKFNKTTGRVISVNIGGNKVPTEELDRLIVKKS